MSLAQPWAICSSVQFAMCLLVLSGLVAIFWSHLHTVCGHKNCANLKWIVTITPRVLNQKKIEWGSMASHLCFSILQVYMKWYTSDWCQVVDWLWEISGFRDWDVWERPHIRPVVRQSLVAGPQDDVVEIAALKDLWGEAVRSNTFFQLRGVFHHGRLRSWDLRGWPLLSSVH